MRNFIKNFVMVMATMILTATVLVCIAAVKFGMINVSSHTDNYVTTCNGVVISEENKTITDSIDFEIDVNEAFNIFSR